MKKCSLFPRVNAYLSYSLFELHWACSWFQCFHPILGFSANFPWIQLILPIITMIKFFYAYLKNIHSLHKSILKHILQYRGINVFLGRCKAFSPCISPTYPSWLHVIMIIVSDLRHMILIVALMMGILVVLILTMVPARLLVMLLIILHIWMNNSSYTNLFLK